MPNCNGMPSFFSRLETSQTTKSQTDNNQGKKSDCDNDKKDRRPRQVEEDYPELGDWAGLKGSKVNSSSELDDVTSKRNSGLNGISPLNQSQYITRRLKLDLRNECEIPIAGQFEFEPVLSTP